MYKEHLVLAIVEDKAAIDVGKENRPITALQRNRKGMQEVNHSNSTVDPTMTSVGGTEGFRN